jgi:hypothetical protein
MALATRMTAADYRATHDDRPERTELIDGEVVLTEAWYVDSKARSVLVFRRPCAESPTFDVRLEVPAPGALASP